MKKNKRIINFLSELFDVEGLTRFFSRKNFDKFVLIFLSLIFLPLIFGITGINDKGFEYIDENRMKVEKPEFSINSIFPYFGKFEAYFNDNFSFRSFLISWYNVLKYNMSGISPLDSVYIGKEGWLFLAKESGIKLDRYYFSFDLFKSSDMKLWKERILQRKNWAESLGCTYLFIVIPNKQTIYPEMMPSGMDTVSSKTMMDQMFEYLYPELDNIVIDLRKKFRKEKEEHRIYQKTDTHWNQWGAYSAYRSILNSLSGISGENIESDDLSEFRIETSEQDGGDLARLLSFHNSKYRDKIITLERKEENNIESNEINPDFADSIVLVNKNNHGQFPPLLFIYDSFGEYLHRYLSSQFIELYLTQNRNLKIYSDLIKKKGVKYIVEEIAERHFLQKPPESLNIIK